MATKKKYVVSIDDEDIKTFEGDAINEVIKIVDTKSGVMDVDEFIASKSGQMER